MGMARTACALLLAVTVACCALRATRAACTAALWSDWSTCPCGGGTQVRHRGEVAIPGSVGATCVNVETDTRPCYGDGGDQCNAALTCRTLIQQHPTTPSGIYWILGQPGATAFQAYCDMDTDGGGWTLVYANSDAVSATARSWDELVAAPTGIDIIGTPFTSPLLVGMVSVDALPTSTTIMIRDAGHWSVGQFSSLRFSSSDVLKQFVHHTIPGMGDACAALPGGDQFVFRTSNGASYSFNQLQDVQGKGYGWGGCNAPETATVTTTCDVEDAPTRWIGDRTSNAVDSRVIGTGGICTTAGVLARAFIREDGPDVDCDVSSWGPWSACSRLCGGIQRRWRQVVTAAQGDGATCPVLVEEQACGQPSCFNACPACGSSVGALGQRFCHAAGRPDLCITYYAGSVMCPAHSVECIPGDGDVAPRDPELCTRCRPGSRGPCQRPDTVCVAAYDVGDGSAGTMRCPVGSSLCAASGSLPALPTVLVDLTLWGVDAASLSGENNTEYVKVSIAATGNVQKEAVIIESIEGTAPGSVGQLGVTRRVSESVAYVGIVIVVDSGTVTSKQVASRFTDATLHGVLQSALVGKGIPVTRVAINTDAAIAWDAAVADGISSQPAGDGPELGPSGMGSSLLLLLVGVGVAALAALLGAWVVVKRRNGGRAHPPRTSIVSSVLRVLSRCHCRPARHSRRCCLLCPARSRPSLRIPKKPLFLPSSVHSVQTFSGTIIGSASLYAPRMDQLAGDGDSLDSDVDSRVSSDESGASSMCGSGVRTPSPLDCYDDDARRQLGFAPSGDLVVTRTRSSSCSSRVRDDWDLLDASSANLLHSALAGSSVTLGGVLPPPLHSPSSAPDGDPLERFSTYDAFGPADAAQMLNRQQPPVPLARSRSGSVRRGLGEYNV